MLNKNLILTIALGVVVTVGIVAGVVLPVAPAQPQVVVGGSQALTNYFREITVNGNAVVSGSLAVTGTVTGTLGTASQPNVTNLGTQTYLTATNLILSGVAFSGPVKYGVSAVYTSGTRIAHGFSTTPTVCLLSPVDLTATVTITSTGFSSNASTRATPLYWICGK